MKIIEKHPKFYTDYKDKTIIKNMYLKGTVIGYCVMYNKHIALMVRSEKIGFDGFFEYFIKFGRNYCCGWFWLQTYITIGSIFIKNLTLEHLFFFCFKQLKFKLF